MSPPLVLLHGFTGTPASWDAVLDRLDQETSRPVWCTPILGHHPSLLGRDPDAPAPARFVDEVDRLAAAIAARFAAPVHLAGYSLGGRLALGLLARHPRRLARVTLIGAHPGLASDAERAERVASDERWARMLEAEGIIAFTAAWEAQPLFATQARLDEAHRARQRAARAAHDPAGLALALRVLGLGRMPRFTTLCADAGHDPAALALPVDLLVGEEDHRFRALGAELARLLPRTTLTLVRGAGHNLPLEAPQAVAAALSRKETAP